MWTKHQMLSWYLFKWQGVEEKISLHTIKIMYVWNIYFDLYYVWPMRIVQWELEHTLLGEANSSKPIRWKIWGRYLERQDTKNRFSDIIEQCGEETERKWKNGRNIYYGLCLIGWKVNVAELIYLENLRKPTRHSRSVSVNTQEKKEK